MFLQAKGNILETKIQRFIPDKNKMSLCPCSFRPFHIYFWPIKDHFTHPIL